VATLDRRQALKLLASVGTAGAIGPALAACGPSASAAPRETINIGLVAPQSGPLLHLGDEITNGFRLYLSANGGRLGGVPVNATVIDEGSTAASGLAAVTNAITSGSLSALVGIASTAVFDAVRDTVEQARIPLLGTGGASSTPHPGREFVWQTGFVYGEAGTAMAAYLSNAQLQVKVHRAILFDDGTPDARSEAEAFSDALAGAGTPPTANWHAITAQTAGSITIDDIATIAAFDPQIVFAACQGQAAVDFLTLYRRDNITAKLFGPGMLTDGSVVQGPVLSAEDGLASGVFTTQNYATNLDNVVNQQFAADYFNASANGSTPSTFAVAAYDAAAVLDIVLGRIPGLVTPHAINLGLQQQYLYSSPRGNWYFNANGSPRQQWYLRQVLPDGTVLQNVALQVVTTLT
jgi:branched-chain amino acid transport system substrate-binding protein